MNVELKRLPPRLSLVVPCFQEAEGLAETVPCMLAAIDALKCDGSITAGSILVIDDGSTDDSWRVITELCLQHPAVSGIKLAGNVGHQRALLCGLLHAPGDVVVSIDADLQDDLGAIRQMVAHYCNGVDIVYGVRGSRHSDSWFKRNSAQQFYKLLSAFGVRTIYNHADFRLMSSRAVDALRQFPERNIYLRGLMPLIGLPSSSVVFDRLPRKQGVTKYSIAKMSALALDAITTLTVMPLRVVTIIGLLIFVASLAAGGWVAATKLFTDRAVPGWTSVALPIYFLGGVQLLCMGILGEYLGKIYIEVKRRPPFIIETTTKSAMTMPDTGDYANNKTDSGT